MDEANILDFRKPIEATKIAGVPVVAREVRLPRGQSLWVPQGISRTGDDTGWYICVAHQGGTSEQNVFDHGRSPLASLKDAFDTLVETFHWDSRERINENRQWSSNLRNEDPRVSTGYTGVAVSRIGSNLKKRAKRVEVSVQLSCRHESGKLKTRAVFQSSFSESTFLANPEETQELFDQQLREAIALRRHDEVLRAQGGIKAAPASSDQVSEQTRRSIVRVPSISLADIFNSFIVAPRIEPLTSGGDPEVLAVRLQSLDLTKPHKTVYLEGRKMAFRRQQVEGRVFYLPQGLYRARGEWRIRVYYEGGVVNEAVTDDEAGGSLMRSLKKAQTLFISECRALPCTQDRVRATRNQILDSCVAGVMIQPTRRERKSGGASWEFSVKVLQKTEGVHRGFTVLHRPVGDMNNAKLKRALCWAIGCVRYRKQLIEQGFDEKDAVMTRDTDVPASLVPDEPVHTITVDDLWYHIEQTEAVKPSKRPRVVR